MKKILWVFLCSTAPLLSLRAQEEPLLITNYLTEKYWDTHTTHISIIPPPGFVRSEDGFTEKSNGATICFEEQRKPVALSHNEYLHSFDSLMTDSQGVNLIEQMKWKINGFDALLIKLTSVEDGEKYISWRLLIGDERFTDIITGTFKDVFENEVSAAIRNSILSAFFDKDKRLLPFGADPTTTSSTPCKCNEKKQ